MNDNDLLIERINRLINEANERQTAAIKRDIKLEVAEVKLEITELKRNVERINAKGNTLEEAQTDLQVKYKALQKSLRKNNVVIYGVKIENTKISLAEYIIQKINQWLELDLTVNCLDNVYPLGKSEVNRPILVKLQSYLTKVRILRNCNKLKGTGISFSEDLTKEEREKLKILVKYKKLAQNKGHKAYIKNNKLYINNQEHTVKQLEEGKEEELEIHHNQEKSKSSSQPSTPAAPEIEESEHESDKEHADGDFDIEKDGARKEKQKDAVLYRGGGGKHKGQINQKPDTKNKRINTRSVKE